MQISTLDTIIFSIILGAFCLVIADRFRIPSIILYLFSGIAFGPYGIKLIRPETLGQGLPTIIILFVCIIILEGGLSLDARSMISIKQVITKQILWGIVITGITCWLTARYVVGLSAELTIVLTSLTVVTGPTVIKPIIRHLSLRRNVSTLLNGEAVIVDAIGAVLAIAVLEYILSERQIGNSIFAFILSLVIGAAIGVVSGRAARMAVERYAMPSKASLNFLVIGIAFLIYILSEYAARESGLMAVAFFGLVLGTTEHKIKGRILSFKDQITRMLVAILFIILSAGFDLERLAVFLTPGLLFVVAIMAVRFPVVFLSTRGTDFSLREKLFTGWMGPRGIIALSMASIASLKLKEYGIQDAPAVELLVFMLISTTVLFQGMSAGFLARKLGILRHGDGNIIILGVHEITLSIAREWKTRQYDAIFVDSREDNCARAVKEGFQCLMGNALDPASYSGLDMDHFNAALGASKNDEINVLFCKYMKENYGIRNVFSALTGKAEKELNDIIIKDKIKLAFGVSGDSTGKRNSIFAQLLLYFNDRIKARKTEKFIMRNPRWMEEKLSENLPDGSVILHTARNAECFLFHESFSFQLNDEVHILTPPRNIATIEGILGPQ